MIVMSDARYLEFSWYAPLYPVDALSYCSQAAYRNVLTKLEFSSTSQHPNAPLNLTEHRDNPWVQGYINMASSLAKYAIAFKKDGPDMKSKYS